MRKELPVEKLRNTCVPKDLGCTSSLDIRTLENIIGQERAVRSLTFGLKIREKGFNIYVAGLPGTGRTTAVKRFLDDIAKDKPVPDDWCYAYNFRDAYRPTILRLPPGKARELEADMVTLVEAARRDVSGAFESEEYVGHVEVAVKDFEKRKAELLGEANKRAQEQGFAIQATPVGLRTVPLREGKPLSEEEFAELSEAEKDELKQKRDQVQSDIEAAIRQGRRIDKDAQEALEKLDREVALYAISQLVEDLRDKYANLPDVVRFLGQVQEDILDNLPLFRGEPEEEEAASPLSRGRMRGPSLRRYEINVIVDNADLEGTPVVMELNPAYGNLFGRVEQEARFGALMTDFTLIRGGSLHRANGGFLVIPVDDLLRNAVSWESLKRALSNGQITIEDVAERFGFITTKSLRPEPIPLDVKVVLIGGPEVYQLLRAYDEDFGELFKVKADFDTQMDRTEENVRDYIAFVCTLCREENLKHLDSSALANVVEHGSRLVADQTKLSTRFNDLADIIREASHYAVEDEAQLVTGEHVQKAIEERFLRSSLYNERINEMIERGVIKIEVEGAKVGQVNGLSVLSLGDIAFGRPNRITASVGLGREGLLDIEREANLGGPIHTKGVMIIAGYLAQKYAQDKPLSLNARLVFEQSYSGVEGDSASSTELYAILSSLSGVPINQGIAVTGSVNQRGEVQAIGGVNEKIEGFFEIVKTKGFSGEQGVLIPESNVDNLMLKEEVVKAVEEGEFHIWSVSTIDEGIEVLTGRKAGEKTKEGKFEDGTINQLVDQRLEEFAESMRVYLGRD